MLKTILIVIGIICFFLAGLQIPLNLKVDWQYLGWGFIAAGVLLPL